MNDLISALSLVMVVISVFLIWINFIVQRVEWSPYHIDIQFNNRLKYFSDYPNQKQQVYRYHQHDKQNEKQKFCCSTLSRIFFSE